MKHIIFKCFWMEPIICMNNPVVCRTYVHCLLVQSPVEPSLESISIKLVSGEHKENPEQPVAQLSQALLQTAHSASFCY